MPRTRRDRAPNVERSAFRGCCEQCGDPFRGRSDKRFCSDKCRTRFGREQFVAALVKQPPALLEGAAVERTS